MSLWQRIKNIIFAVLMLLLAWIMLNISEDDYDIIATIIAASMLIFGIRLLYFYGTMARHMVGGKIMLYEAIIILDIGLFTLSVSATVSASEPYIILFYLLNIYAVAGAIHIMRSFEEKNNGLRTWKRRLFSGSFMIIYSITLVVLAVIFKKKEILKYGYCISLVYAAIVRIMNAFRKTAIVYIQ